MTPRLTRGAVDDVDGWRRPGAVDDADGLRRLSAEEWDALAVRRPGAVDAERGSPRRPGDVDDAFRRMSNAEVQDKTIALLRQKVKDLDPKSDPASWGRELLNQVDAGEVKLLVKGDRNYQRLHERWFGAPEDIPARGTVNLDSGEILIRRSQVGSVEEVMLTAFHEGVHYQDYDNVMTLDREMHAFRRTAQFAEAVGLEYRALGQDLTPLGDTDLTQVVEGAYGDGINEFALRRKMSLDPRFSQSDVDAVFRYLTIDDKYQVVQRALASEDPLIRQYHQDRFGNRTGVRAWFSKEGYAKWIADMYFEYQDWYTPARVKQVEALLDELAPNR